MEIESDLIHLRQFYINLQSSKSGDTSMLLDLLISLCGHFFFFALQAINMTRFCNHFMHVTKWLRPTNTSATINLLVFKDIIRLVIC